MIRKICVQCGSIRKAKGPKGATRVLEIVLWLLLIVPGLIFTICRKLISGRKCRYCGGQLVPTQSVKGRVVMQHFDGMSSKS